VIFPALALSLNSSRLLTFILDLIIKETHLNGYIVGSVTLKPALM
jgi:hypothetical protein